MLNLGSTILHLMGFTEGHLTDAVYEHYYSLARRAAHVNLAKTHALLDVWAQEIYEALQTLLPHTA